MPDTITAIATIIYTDTEDENHPYRVRYQLSNGKETTRWFSLIEDAERFIDRLSLLVRW